METTKNTQELEFIFLSKRYAEDEKVYVIQADRLTEINCADTYDRYGQLIGYENAGDYHPENSYCDFTEGDEPVLSTCTGFNYWNGHSWATVCTSCSNIDELVTHDVIEDPELIAKYTQAIEEKEFFADGFGSKKYHFQDLLIVESYAQGSWESFLIIPYVE